MNRLPMAFGIYMLLITGACPASAQENRIGSTGAITGRVIVGDANGVQASGATVSVSGLSLITHADSLGRFFIRPIPPGEQVIRVQQLGFRVLEQTVTITANTVTTVDFRLLRPETKMDTVRVKADNWLHKPARLLNTTKYDEFYERKLMSGGGIQLTHEELEKRVNASLADVFSSIPGIHIQRVGSRYTITLPFCREQDMVVFVDNQQVFPVGGEHSTQHDHPLDVLAQLDLEQIEAMEIYKSLTGMPARARGDACAAIFIWTR